MNRALELSLRASGQTSPNPMVGAVVVKNGNIIAEAFHEKAGGDHAERAALKTAGAEAAGSTLYVSLEPCCHKGKTPPCTDIIIQSGIKKVVAACLDPFPHVQGRGVEILRKAGIEVETGLLEKKARRINETFFCYHEKRRPFIILKWAMTLDGRTSTDNGQSKWITSEKSRLNVHSQRSLVDAILVGSGTVLKDNPRLDVRLPDYTGPHPCKIILAPDLDLPVNLNVFKSGGKVLIYHGESEDNEFKNRADRLKEAGAEIVALPLSNGKLEIKSLLRSMYDKQIQSVLVEGGRITAGMFMQAHAVDKITAYISPRIIGGRKATSPLIYDGVATVNLGPFLKDVVFKQFDSDIYLDGYVENTLVLS